MVQNDEKKLSKDESQHQKNLERIKRLRLLDDDFLSVCFDRDNECTQFVLRILLNKNDLKVVEVKTQYSVKNLQGHSVILDVFATDSNNIRYDIEIQRADKGASPKRARYNSSLIDDQILIAGDSYEVLPETYVIFITENDVIGKGKPIYHIERMITETGEAFEDGSHIVYVNAAYKDDSQLGKLMYDFSCADPNEMNYPVLAQKTRYFKEETKGVTNMCKIMEELKAEGFAEGRAEGRAEGEKNGRAENAIENAIRMLKDGLRPDKISQYTELPIEKIEKLAALIAD